MFAETLRLRKRREMIKRTKVCGNPTKGLFYSILSFKAVDLRHEIDAAGTQSRVCESAKAVLPDC